MNAPKNDGTRITAAQIRFIRRTAGCTKWDHKRNGEIMHELETGSVLEHIGRDRSGEDHVKSIDRRNSRKEVLQCLTDHMV